MSGPYVFDTSIFIHIIRKALPSESVVRPLSAGRAYLSSVVAHELWAGTRTRDDAADLATLIRAFESVGAILTPSHEDWIAAGRLITRYQRLYGAMAPRDHSHDVLIVLCAAQVGGTVLTANPRHMDRWARLARRAGRTITVESMVR